MFIPAEIIKKKRNNGALSSEEISFFINEYTKGAIPDYQMSALLMAIFFVGMNDQETAALTQTMLHSGVVVDLSEIDLYKVDKHSTGGVGDKTSLILGPLVAACGVPVPMISGRGLGHTGGTLDKLESVPGFNIHLSLEDFKKSVKKHNICFIGQTKDICPADKKIYALRDVTATVESLPLICASIMSKKIAEGIDGLVLDVKWGSGAFMKKKSDAEHLARKLMAIAKYHKKNVTALLTNMNQPLGRYAGNALEVFECVEIMKNKTYLDPLSKKDLYEDTRELSLQLSAHMIFLAAKKMSSLKVNTIEEAYELAKKTLVSGAAYSKFVELCQIHKGDLNKLPMPTVAHKIQASTSGFLAEYNTEAIGYAGVALKAGRLQTSDTINPVSGIEFHKKIGDEVRSGDVIYTLHGDHTTDFAPALERLQSSFSLAAQASHVPLIDKLIYENEI